MSVGRSPIRSPIRVDRSRTRFECPERKGKRSSSASDREVRMEREGQDRGDLGGEMWSARSALLTRSAFWWLKYPQLYRCVNGSMKE